MCIVFNVDKPTELVKATSMRVFKGDRRDHPTKLTVNHSCCKGVHNAKFHAFLAG